MRNMRWTQSGSNANATGAAWITILNDTYPEGSVAGVRKIVANVTAKAPSAGVVVLCCIRILVNGTQISMGGNSCGSPALGTDPYGYVNLTSIAITNVSASTSPSFDVQLVQAGSLPSYYCYVDAGSVSIVMEDFGALP